MRKSAEVIIVGGGISGCSIAYNLAKKGVKDIVVLEKRFICGGSTGACGAGVRMQWGTEMNCRFSKFSIELYQKANETLEYDGDIEFRQSGYLLISDDERELAQFEKNIEVQHECAIPSRMVTLKEAKELVPHLNTDILKGAAFCEKDGFLNPFLTTDAFYRAARRMGVEFHTNTTVTDIAVENGRVTGVLTDKGFIASNRVVNAAGRFFKGNRGYGRSNPAGIQGAASDTGNGARRAYSGADGNVFWHEPIRTAVAARFFHNGARRRGRAKGRPRNVVMAFP